MNAEALVDQRVDQLLLEHDPLATSPGRWWAAQYDLGLAWVHFPPGDGGLGVSSSLQEVVNRRLLAAGAPNKALLNSRSATIGGGTTEIQRNTIAERVLGLPKEPSPGR